MGVGIKPTAGPVIERTGDLSAILSNLQIEGDALHRRDPPPEPLGRGDPLLGHGGLQPRHRHRPGPERPEPQAPAPEIHPHRGHDPGRPDHGPAPEPVRHHPPPGLLPGRGHQAGHPPGGRILKVKIDDEGAAQIALRSRGHAARGQPPAAAGAGLRRRPGRSGDHRAERPSTPWTRWRSTPSASTTWTARS